MKLSLNVDKVLHKYLKWSHETIHYHLESVRFLNVFQRSLFCSPRLHLFDQKDTSNNLILLQFKMSHDPSAIILI